ncbi:glycosyl transferase, family 2 protein [[Pasteurella] aerogenes]|nr:glycosyl transferase, family 2 protein [[Pasteurella] aerogenes]
MTKVLSIVVPSYNAQYFLLESIPTMVSIPNREQLEVVIVNDGSKDDTLAVANKFKSDFPNIITVIDKENGGHGSTINAGIRVARGKYFKVVDADDWVIPENLADLVSYLASIDDDQVISPFIKIYMDTSEQEVVSYNVLLLNQTYQYEKFLKEINCIPSMHSITIKTEILRKNNIFIDENCFYVDLEYNTFPMPFIKTVSYFDKPVYKYRLGMPNQSVNINSYIKNVSMHKKVIFSLISFFNNYNSASKIEYELLKKLILEVISIHSNIYLAMSDTRKAKVDFLLFEKELKSKNPLFIQLSTGKKLLILRKSNYTFFSILSYFYKINIRK